MKSMMLAAAVTLAAAALSANPAAGRQFGSGGRIVDGAAGQSPFACANGVRVSGTHHDRRSGRAVCNADTIMDVYGGEWALYNNRSWEPDSYNDWWHDRPDRAYPAWMRRNENCDRRWFSGDTLRC
jgi:hypothetical protein